MNPPPPDLDATAPAAPAGTVGAGPDALSTIDPPVRWCRPAGWTHRVLDDEVLLLDANRTLVTLTGLAAPVWLELDRPGSVGEVTDRITRRWPSRPVGADAVGETIALLVEGATLAEFEPGAARIWGIADNDAVVEVVVARSLLGDLARRWPVLGLRPAIERPAGDQLPAARLGLGATGLFVPDDLSELSEDPTESTWGVLEQTLAVVAVTSLTHLVTVHAAVIARGGQVMLVPATSGAGKSTLTVAAHRAGATVLSDEYALVDPHTGLVTGWPRPVRVRLPDGTEERRNLAQPSEPLPVGMVASLTYERGAANTWEPVSSSAAVLDLLANTVVARTRPDASLDAALAVCRRARAVKGTRGEADDAIAVLLTLLDDGDPVPADVTPD